MDSLENFPVYNSQGDIPLIETPLFPRGYGISTTDNNQNDDIMIDAWKYEYACLLLKKIKNNVFLKYEYWWKICF